MKKVIIILISLLLLSGCGSKNDKGTDIALNDKRFYNIYESLLEYTYKDIRENGYKSFTNTELLQIAYRMLEPKDVKFSYSKDDMDYYSISCETINNYLKDIFGDDVEFNGKRVSIDARYDIYDYLESNLRDKVNASVMEIDSYNEADNSLIVSFGGRGTDFEKFPYNTSRKIIKATMYDDEIIVKEGAIYIEEKVVEDTEDYQAYVYLYDSPEKAVLINTFLAPYDHLSEDISKYYKILEDAYDNYSEEGYIITHIFKKGKNNKYYFAGSTYK